MITLSTASSLSGGTTGRGGSSSVIVGGICGADCTGGGCTGGGLLTGFSVGSGLGSVCGTFGSDISLMRGGIGVHRGGFTNGISNVGAGN